MGRKYKQLSKDDWIKIHTLLSCNKTQKEIAQELKVHRSTITLLNNQLRKTLKFNTSNEFFLLILYPVKKIALDGWRCLNDTILICQPILGGDRLRLFYLL